MRRTALKQLKVIVSLDGAGVVLSTKVAVAADPLALANLASASLITADDDYPMLVVTLSAAPDLPAPSGRLPEPSIPFSMKLTTEDGRVLTTEAGVPLILPDDLHGA